MTNNGSKLRNTGQSGAALTEILAITLAVAIAVGIIITKLKPGMGVAQYIPGGEVGMASLVLAKGSGGKPAAYRLEADATILYTKKVACRANTNIINTSIEMWHIEKGTWPKEDLSDIGRDRFYFPNGIPKCPVNNTPYRMDPFLYRVAGHEHVDIPDPFASKEVSKQKRLKGEKKKKKAGIRELGEESGGSR